MRHSQEPTTMALSAADSLIFVDALGAERPNEALHLAMARRAPFEDPAAPTPSPRIAAGVRGGKGGGS